MRKSDLSVFSAAVVRGGLASVLFSGLVMWGCAPTTDDAEGVELVQEDLTADVAYVVRPVHSGKCLDVSGNNDNDGSVVHQWDCHRRPNQQFRLRAAGGGTFELVAQHSNKCLDVVQSGTDDGARVQQWACNGNQNQRWRVTNRGGGQHDIQAVHSGRCLEVAGASNSRGAAVQQRACGTASNQRFTFSLLSGGNPSPQPPPSDPGSGLTWRKANLTWYTSYPDPGSEECVKYNGCTWAGQFAFAGKQSKAWVMSHNIAAIHSKDANTYKLKKLRLRQGSKQIDVTVYDMCSDSDCNGCCTANSRSTGFLIDIESYTADRFGARSGIVDWACLDCD